MDFTTKVRIVSGVLGIIILAILVLRRAKKPR